MLINTLQVHAASTDDWETQRTEPHCPVQPIPVQKALLVSAAKQRGLVRRVATYLSRASLLDDELATERAKAVVKVALVTASQQTLWEYNELERIALRIALEQVVDVAVPKCRVVPVSKPVVMMRAAELRAVAPLRGSWWVKLLTLNLRETLKPSVGGSS